MSSERSLFNLQVVWFELLLDANCDHLNPKEAKRSNSILLPFKSLLVRKLNGQVYGS